MGRSGWFLAVEVAATTALAFCASAPAEAKEHDPGWTHVLPDPLGGISGLARLGSPGLPHSLLSALGAEGDYLAVHDNKDLSRANEPRFSLLRVHSFLPGSPDVRALPCWTADPKEDLPVDFEAISGLPGGSDEFVAVAKVRNVFPAKHLLCHLALSWAGVEVRRTVPLKHVPSTDPDVEGFAVKRMGKTDVAVWAHRGGMAAPAVVYAGRLDLNAKADADVLVLDVPGQEVTVDFFPGCTDRRPVSDLEIDWDGAVWATAACELPSMNGALYVLGRVSVGPDGKAALDLKRPSSAEATFPGHKVEALQIMPERGGRFLLGSDDELQGGSLRVPALPRR